MGGSLVVTMLQLIQIAAAVLLLAGFAAAQLNATTTTSRIYLAANTVGAGCLVAIAYLGRNWGFLLLEGSWAFVSLLGLVRRAIGSAAKDRACGHSTPSTVPHGHPGSPA